MPPAKNAQEELRCEIIGITLLALAALTLISVWNPTVGLVGRLFNRALMILAGEGRYLFPLLLAAFGFKLLYRKSKIKKSVNVYGAVIAMVVALTLLHLPVPKEYVLQAGIQGDGGGLIGGVVYYVLLNSFGVLGMYIVLCAMVLVAMLLLTNQSVAVMAQKVFRKTSSALKKQFTRWMISYSPLRRMNLTTGRKLSTVPNQPGGKGITGVTTVKPAGAPKKH